MKRQISISTLNVNNCNKFLNTLQNIKEKIIKIDNNSYEFALHFDIMDNKFVSNTGVSLDSIKLAKKYNMFADVHLMVEKPIEDGYIDKAIKYGANRITIHYEIENFEKTLQYLKKQNIEIGVAIKPSTDIDIISKYKEDIDLLLIMSVEPGYGGQKYIEKTNEKLYHATNLYPNLKLQVDGGVNFETIRYPLELGVKSIVIGSYLTGIEKFFLSRLLALEIQKDILFEDRTENINFSKNILQIVEGGYGSNDILLGIRTPNMRSISKKWFKHISFDILDIFIKSNIHEFRQFAVFSIVYMFEKSNNDDLKKDIYEFSKQNIIYINNWDLTDIIGPNVFGKYLITKEKNYYKKEINNYIKSDYVWKKRIGIVLLLTFARNNNLDIIFEVSDKVIYESYHLYQKATGWVLREAYKKDKNKVFDYLYRKNKEERIPSICLSYACEKMTKEEKEKIRNLSIV